MRNIMRVMFLLALLILPLSRAFAEQNTLNVSIVVSISATVDVEWANQGAGQGSAGAIGTLTWTLSGKALNTSYYTNGKAVTGGTLSADGTVQAAAGAAATPVLGSFTLVNYSQTAVQITIAATDSTWTNNSTTGGGGASTNNKYDLAFSVDGADRDHVDNGVGTSNTYCDWNEFATLGAATNITGYATNAASVNGICTANGLAGETAGGTPTYATLPLDLRITMPKQLKAGCSQTTITVTITAASLS